MRDIARRLKTRTAVVAGVLQAEGLHHVRRRGEPAPFARKIREAEEPTLIAAYGQGAGSSELACRYDCSARTILSTLRRLGVEIRRAGGASPYKGKELSDRVAALWNDGLSQRAIACRTEISQPVVSRILRTLGLSTSDRAAGSRHGQWKGGRSVTGEGYVLVLVAPGARFAEMRNRAGYVPEHRLRMAEHLGRALKASETVHHINGVRRDNRIENLQLRQGKHGTGVCLRCARCGSEDITSAPLE